MRTCCLVEIDGENDHKMNYNLMVLGFPTVLRVRVNEPGDAFLLNRTVDAFFTLVVNKGAVESFGDCVRPDLNNDDEYDSKRCDRNRTHMVVVDEEESKLKSERSINRNLGEDE